MDDIMIKFYALLAGIFIGIVLLILTRELSRFIVYLLPVKDSHKEILIQIVIFITTIVVPFIIHFGRFE